MRKNLKDYYGTNLLLNRPFTNWRRLSTAWRRASLPLGEALALFERGTQLAELCDRLLNEAELRVRQIVPDISGAVDAVPFDSWQRETSL